MINNISWYDWQPDTVITDSILVDVDFDTFPDIIFRRLTFYAGASPSSGSYYNYFATVSAIDSSVLVSPGVQLDASGQFWNCLDSGEAVNQSLTWGSGYNIRGEVIMAGAIGIWDTNINGGYIGFQLSKLGRKNYGWIKVAAQARTSIILSEFAINHTSSLSIAAGQRH